MNSLSELTCLGLIRDDFSNVWWVRRSYNTPPGHLTFRYQALYVNFSDIDIEVIYGLGNLREVLQDELLEFVERSRSYSG